MAYDTSTVSLGAPTRKSDYDRLMDNIIDLAGSGRTTEDIKTNYDLIANAIKTTSVNYTVLDDDGYKVVLVTASATITLPTALSNGTRELTIINAAASGTVTVDGEDAETINGATTVKLAEQYSIAKIVCDATEWLIVGGNVAKNIAKAWINFNGVAPVAIADSFNVSSVTYNASGDYTINFINAMSDVNYVMVGSAGHSGSARHTTPVTAAVGSMRMNTERTDTGTNIDSDYILLAFFGS